MLAHYRYVRYRTDKQRYCRYSTLMNTLPDSLQKIFDHIFSDLDQQRPAFAPQMLPHDVDVMEPNRDTRHYFAAVERVESEPELDGM